MRCRIASYLRIEEQELPGLLRGRRRGNLSIDPRKSLVPPRYDRCAGRSSSCRACPTGIHITGWGNTSLSTLGSSEILRYGHS